MSAGRAAFAGLGRMGLPMCALLDGDEKPTFSLGARLAAERAGVQSRRG